MRKVKFIWGILILTVFGFAACSKANAPTKKNFEAAINNFMEKHPKSFAIYSSPFPKEVVLLQDGKIQCNTPCNFTTTQFSALKNAGLYVQQGKVPMGTVSQPNPKFPLEMAKYKKKMEIYKRNLKKYNEKLKDYIAKAKKKAKWCITQNFGFSNQQNGAPPPSCYIFIARTENHISWLSNELTLNAAEATHSNYPDFIPAPPLKPIEPSKPTDKYISVPKFYPSYALSGRDSTCATDMMSGLESCKVHVGRFEFSKIISSTQPASNADGVIVSQVRFATKPRLFPIANSIPATPKNTEERVFTISLVKQTQGWSGEGPDGGIISPPINN